MILLSFEGEEVINKYKKDEGYMLDKEANMSELPKNGLKRAIWLLFEYPHSSIFARLVAVISVVVVVVSITIFCVETLPEVKARRAALTAPSTVSSSAQHHVPVVRLPPNSSSSPPLGVDADYSVTVGGGKNRSSSFSTSSSQISVSQKVKGKLKVH